ncbi:MAG: menaquinone biosynthesis protein [Planctomycetota bacterium]
MHRVASVAYVNAKPLIHGLADGGSVELDLAVPSRLLSKMKLGGFDVALLPTIDLQRWHNFAILPVGGIGCDGETLTVRLFSRRPLEHIRHLAVDGDSHTSVALSRIVLEKLFGIVPERRKLAEATGEDDEALLLIGDKVVCEEPAGYDHQLDLGLAWKRLTGLPFVFAVWTQFEHVDLGDLPSRLVTCREEGLQPAVLDAIVRDHAVPRGWPAGLAMRYFTEFLRYEIGPRQLEAIRLFHTLAHEVGALSEPPRDVLVAPTTTTQTPEAVG